MKFIYLSPHFDDICYSLSAISRSLMKGDLVNIFTRCTYAKPHILNSKENQSTEDFVSEIRNKEDHLFAEALNLNKQNLGFQDAGVQGNPFNLDSLGEEVDKVEERLIGVLLEKLENSQNVVIFCPLGVGNHRDHLTIFNIVWKNLEALESKGAKVCFYEDLPYSSYTDLRLKRINELSDEFLSAGFTRCSKNLNEQEVKQKIIDIKMYNSQLAENADISLSKYSPAQDSDKIHEAIWFKPDAALNNLFHDLR